jgi:hypothetical protein
MSIDWSCVAEPQVDGSDTAQLLALRMPLLARKWEDLGARIPADAPRFCRQQIAVAHTLRSLPPDLADASLDHPNVAGAERHLALWPAIVEQLPRFVRCVHPVKVVSSDPRMQRASFSGSSWHEFGTIYASVEDSMAFAEAMVHELAHTKLIAIGIGTEYADRFFRNDSAARYPSPILDVPRPMPAVFHAEYSFIHILQLDLLMYRDARDEGERHKALSLIEPTHQRMTGGLRTIRDHVIVDDDGRAFLDGFMKWATRVLDESGAALRSPS